AVRQASRALAPKRRLRRAAGNSGEAKGTGKAALLRGSDRSPGGRTVLLGGSRYLLPPACLRIARPRGARSGNSGSCGGARSWSDRARVLWRRTVERWPERGGAEGDHPQMATHPEPTFAQQEL